MISPFDFLLTLMSWVSTQKWLNRWLENPVSQYSPDGKSRLNALYQVRWIAPNNNALTARVSGFFIKGDGSGHHITRVTYITNNDVFEGCNR